jgi:hypothetical protein
MKSSMRDYDRGGSIGCFLELNKTNVMEEPTVKDGLNIKDNTWNKYHDHAFGGGEPERSRIKVFPQSRNLLLSRKRSFIFGDTVHPTKILFWKIFFMLCMDQLKVYEMGFGLGSFIQGQ